MGYYVSCYLTDANKVKSILGSKNLSVFEELCVTFKDDLDENDEWFEDDLEKGKNSKEVLLDLINGEIRFPDIPFLYGYLYILVCKHFGKQIFSESGEIGAGYYWVVGPDNSAFVPIPFSEDFPQINSISKENLLEQRKYFLDAQNSPDYKNEYPEDITAFEQIFDRAIQENKDLVFTCH